MQERKTDPIVDNVEFLKQPPVQVDINIGTRIFLTPSLFLGIFNVI